MFGDQTIQDNALSFYDMAQALVALEEQIKKRTKIVYLTVVLLIAKKMIISYSLSWTS